MDYFFKISYKLSSTVFISCILILGFYIHESASHGMLMEPVNRGSAWRLGYDTPINYDDNQNFCGGFYIQYAKNKGKCGLCGDSYSLKQPRPNENGGIFGTGTIVKEYTEGQEFWASVIITAHHGGYFQFSLCPLDNSDDIETEECFKRHPIYTVNGEDRYPIGEPTAEGKQYDIKLVLPKNVTCNHCTLRWHWTVGNNWGICGDGSAQVGCGAQETFITCSDITINKTNEKGDSLDYSILD